MKKYLVWIIEVLVWLLVAVIIVMGVSLYRKVKLKQKHSYHVFFSDANGLKDGSPVKIMGNEIGYVTNVRIINNDEVFVSFVITSPGMELALGTKANIELTGLVGSRSLELYPPKSDEPKTANIVQPLNADRLSEKYNDSTTVAEIIYNGASGMNRLIPVEKIPFFRNLVKETSAEITDIPIQIDIINQKQTDAINKVKDNKKLRDFREKMEKTAR